MTAQTIGGCALEASIGMSSAVCAAGGERPEGTDTTTSDTSLSFEMELDNGYTLSAVAGKGDYQYQDGLEADWLPLEFIGVSRYFKNTTIRVRSSVLPLRLTGASLG